ncbi:MAG: diguanylate cyclase [Chloroflexi bacterium]|nr:diguanylate cyclase [Chloroflexota bacterium]
MAEQVGALIRRHRAEIVHDWVASLKSLEGTSFVARSLEELVAVCGDCCDAFLQVLEEGSFGQVHRFIQDIAPVLAGQGFRAAEAQRAFLHFKETIWPLLSEAYQGDFIEFMNAVRQIDSCLNVTIYEFSEVYSALSARTDAYVRELEEVNRKLELLAVRDSLTGLYNHRYFQDRLREEIGRAQRYQRSLSLLMADLDDFKRVNDEHSHQRGDDVIRQVAALVQRNIREVDVPARYGGEEFAVVFPETSIAGAAIAAERVRRAVAEFDFEIGEPVTISIGLACYPKHATTAVHLIELGDRALYLAKRGGKNRVVVWAEQPQAS